MSCFPVLLQTYLIITTFWYTPSSSTSIQNRTNNPTSNTPAGSVHHTLMSTWPLILPCGHVGAFFRVFLLILASIKPARFVFRFVRRFIRRRLPLTINTLGTYMTSHRSRNDDVISQKELFYASQTNWRHLVAIYKESIFHARYLLFISFHKLVFNYFPIFFVIHTSPINV